MYSKKNKDGEDGGGGGQHIPQEKLSKLDLLDRWFSRDMLFMLELVGLRGVLQPRACGKRWW